MQRRQFNQAAVGATAQERLLPLDSAAGLILHNTQAAAVSFESKSALKQIGRAHV